MLILASAFRRSPILILRPPSLRFFLLGLASAIALFFPFRVVAEPSPYCTKAMLDIRVLPPLEPDTPEKIRALVVEIENRSEFACQFSGYAYSGTSPSTPSELDFADRKLRVFFEAKAGPSALFFR